MLRKTSARRRPKVIFITIGSNTRRLRSLFADARHAIKKQTIKYAKTDTLTGEELMRKLADDKVYGNGYIMIFDNLKGMDWQVLEKGVRCPMFTASGWLSYEESSRKPPRRPIVTSLCLLGYRVFVDPALPDAERRRLTGEIHSMCGITVQSFDVGNVIVSNDIKSFECELNMCSDVPVPMRFPNWIHESYSRSQLAVSYDARDLYDHYVLGRDEVVDAPITQELQFEDVLDCAEAPILTPPVIESTSSGEKRKRDDEAQRYDEKIKKSRFQAPVAHPTLGAWHPRKDCTDVTNQAPAASQQVGLFGRNVFGKQRYKLYHTIYNYT